MKKTRRIDHISKKMKFIGTLTGEQRNRLTEIADKCPVHQSLTKGVIIETEEI